MGLSGRLSGAGRLSGNLIGSGTYDYNDLNNKPQINSVTLHGNKSSSDLGLQDEINFPGDANKYLNGAGNFTTPSGGSGDYDDLSDKPQINGVTLEGNCSSDDLQLQDKIQFPMTPNVYLDGEGNFTAIVGIDYDNLTNKPTINGYVLSGAVSLSDIGAEPTISYSGNLIQYMDGTGNFTIPNYNNIQNRPQINGHILTGDQSSDDLDLQDKINFPEDSTQFLDGTGTFRTPDYFSGDYDDLTDKPSINGETLEGDKSSSDLHLVSEVHDVGPAAEVNFEADDTLPLLNCICEFNPSQDLHGYSKPWAGGAGKNILPNKVSDIKSINTVGTWSGNIYSINNGTIEILVDSDNNIIGFKVNGTFNATSVLFISTFNAINGTTYYINGCPEGGSSDSYELMLTLGNIGSGAKEHEYGSGVSYTEDTTTSRGIQIVIRSGYNADNLTFFPMVRTSGDSTYEPFSNICPISGHFSVTVTVASTSGGSGEDYTVSLGSTYYGGSVDASTGRIDATWDNIASYAGETLPGAWLSSLDEYDPLGTPTIGAQVVYEAAAPSEYSITGTKIETLNGDNYVRCDTRDIQVTYVTDIADPLLKWLLENR